MKEKRERDRLARLRLEEDDEDERYAEEEYEEMLKQEAAELNIRGFEPKVSPMFNFGCDYKPANTEI